MKIDQLMLSRYLPYAEETIKNRAVPYIDGCKPVQRRVLWACHELGLDKKDAVKKKSARIVGDTMGKYHPHGDSAIYEAMCSMEEKYEGFNEPLIAGQGSFGKVYSNPKLDGGLHPAQMRYSEAGLTEIAALMFDGINDGAVPMVPNYDETEKEPMILPSKFPNIMVNANKGVAVGLSSYVPSYTLKNSCLAIASMLRGKVHTPEEVVDILGAPDFPTGGTVHCDNGLLLKLLKDGRATFTVTGDMHQADGNIVIDSVPIGVSFEKVTAQLKELAQKPDGRDIVDITSNVGLNSSGIFITVRKNANLRQLALKIYQNTDVRSTISFLTQIIWNGKPLEMGTYELMEKWINFRSLCVESVYKNKTIRLEVEAHKKSVWGIIFDELDFVIDTMRKESENTARQILGDKFTLDDDQLDYLFNLRIKTICKDKALQEMDALKKIESDLAYAKMIRDDENKRYELIASELEEIAEKYGKNPVCRRDDLVPEAEKIKTKAEIPHTHCTVFITKRGFVKCVKEQMFKDAARKYMTDDDDLAVPPIYTTLDDTLLVYTYSGMCYKIPIIEIEGSKTGFKQYFWDLVERKDNSPVLYACDAAEYNRCFTIVYGNGRGRIVYTSDVSGRNKSYKNNFLPGNNIYGSKDRIFIVPYRDFYMITKNKKAAYGTTKYIGALSSRQAFKVARTTDNDPVVMFINASEVNEEGVDRERYSKDYCVKAVEPNLIEAIEANWAKN